MTLTVSSNLVPEQPRLALLYQISREISSRLNTEELLPRLLQLSLSAVGGHTASLVELDAHGRLLHSALLIDGQPHPAPNELMRAVMERGLLGWVLQHREAVYVPNTAADPRWYQPHDPSLAPTRSVIVVPLMGRDRVVGAITIGHLAFNAFEPDDVALTGAIGAQAGIAIENAQLFAAERRSLELSTTLREVARAVNISLDLSQVLPLILDQLARVVAYDSAAVLLRTGDSLRVAVARGFTDLSAVMAVTFDATRGLAGRVLGERRSVVIDDVQRVDEWQSLGIPESKIIRAWIGVPLIAKDEVMGLLSVDCRRPGVYGPEDGQLVSAFAEQAAVAVRNAALYAESERRSYGLRALTATGQAINGTFELDEVLRLVVEHAREWLGMEAASLAMVAGDRLVFKQTLGPVGEALRGATLKLGEGIAGWVAQHNEPLIVPDVRSEPRFFAGLDAQSGYVTRSLACVPIQIDNRAIGVIEVLNPASGHFDPDTLDLLTSLASLAGTAIAQSQRVTELKAAENRFTALFEDSLDPILITNLEGTITDANRRSAEFFGYPRTELVGMRVTHLHRVHTDSLASGRYTPLLTGAAISYQTRITTHAGQEVPVEVHAKLIERGGAKFIHWIQHDLSDRVALEELRNDLLSMIVHDLRSPLGNIMSALDILRSTLPGDDEMLNSVLSIAGRAATRLSRLVNSLLDLRRLETGDVMLDRVPIDPLILLREAIEQVQPMSDAKAIQLRTVAPARLAEVPLDVDMIRRVLINLLDNAVKYTPQGGSVTVSVKTGRERLTFSVRDNGPGIPEGEHERIFDKFTRVQRQSAPQGLGLGLAFCKLAIEAHGGRIWVESVDDSGANFLFVLPVLPIPPRTAAGSA